MSTWNKDLTVGVDFLDGEHETMIATLNDLEALIATSEPGPAGPAVRATYANKVGKLLDRLWVETDSHFSHEQQVMAESDYPEIGVHTAQHEKFLKELRELTTRHDNGEAAVAAGVVSFVQLWFARHTLDSDQPLSEWLHATRSHALERPGT
jgi:hemerythrin